jgi:hypothetical protein
MSIVQLAAFDLATASPWQVLATNGFWASMPRLCPGIPAAKLWMVADTLHLADVQQGFTSVAVPEADLPPGIRMFHQQYLEFLGREVEEVRHIRLYLAMESSLNDAALCSVLGTYGVQARPLDAPVPLPFTTGDDRWRHVLASDGQCWGMLRSRSVQYGLLFPRSLHRLFALDFPVWTCLNIYTYSEREAQKLLRLKAATAKYNPGKTDEDQQEAHEVGGAVGRLRAEMNRSGGLLHTMRLYLAACGRDPEELGLRLEMARSSVPLDMAPVIPAGETFRKVFSAAPLVEDKAAPLTTPGLALLTGSALSYRRRTETRGVLLGIDRNQAPVILDIFDPRNPSYNMAVLGQTGSGKTFAVLTLMLRHMLLGARQIIVDPQGNVDLGFLGDEVCHRAVIGTGAAAINILDIAHEELSVQVETVRAMLTLLGVLRSDDPVGRAILDEVLLDIYQPLWGREAPAPTLEAVRRRLEMLAGRAQLPAVQEAALLMAYTLVPYASGSYAALFGQQTTVDFSLTRPVTIYDVSRLPGQELGGNLRSALLAILVADINQSIRRLRRAGNTTPILFFVDEMGMLMRDAVLARYVSGEYKTARARRVAMIVADQTLNSLLGPRDVSGLHHGGEILANAAFKLLFYQDDAERQRIRDNFAGLPAGLREAVHTFPRGVCLAQLPDDLLVVQVRPSGFERLMLSSQLSDREARLKAIEQLRKELQQ